MVNATPAVEDLKTPPRRYDIQRVRADFPILGLQVHRRPLVYLDNAATTQKPQVVLDALSRYYTEQNANVHRGVHHLSQVATEAYDGARSKVRRFFNAASDREIIFTRNATESINLVAQAYARPKLQAGDEVLISAMEHHSNIVPWQLVCAATGAHLRIAPMDDSGELLLADFERLLTDRTKIVAVSHMSNALGTVNPVADIVRMAHARNVQALGADFYVATGHKLYGPTGIGVLYGRAALLESMPPFLGGGDMIASVTFEGSTWNELPYKFEAGTPHIEGAVGLGAAIDYIESIGLDAIAAHEQELLVYGTQVLEAIPGVRMIGTAPRKASILSFVMDGIHPHDIGTIVDREGVAIRTGHHCAQPVMDRLGIPATARASLAMYNTREELDVLGVALRKVIEVLG
jgi:cysteine desulfurase/selenocysteine lyase